jgi:hypothetical protein
MGRVNAFLHLLATGKPKRSSYTTDDDLLPDGHQKAKNKIEKADTYKPNQATADAARRALEVRASKPPSQRGGTAVGLARARDLANRKELPIETVRRMVSYFARHEVDKKGSTWSEQGKGWQAWGLWGGDPGRAWANAIVRRVDAKKEAPMAYIEKPYPNEHASRQKPPEGFARFRRGELPGAPAGVSAVFGVRPDGAAEIQSIRFSRSKWTPARAKDWLSDHGFKTGGFEEATGGKKEAAKVDLQVPISKVDEDQRLAFGWLYVTKRADGSQVVDHSGETISISELERAGYGFALNSRRAKAMHTGGDVGRIAELLVSTPEKREAMGIPEGVLPDGLWIGVKVDDPDAWEGVKSGRFKMFSLGGKAIRRALADLEGDNDGRS